MTAKLFTDCAFQPDLVHQAVVAYMAGGRQGSAVQKTRGQVRGGGRKPWKQKRLGRARAGSIRSPLWRGGGVTFAAQGRDHSVRINKRMFRAALRSILAEKARRGQVHILHSLEVAEPKTRLLLDLLGQEKLQGNLLLVTADRPENNLQLAARNIPEVAVVSVRQLNPVDLMHADTVAIVKPGIPLIEEWLS